MKFSVKTFVIVSLIGAILCDLQIPDQLKDDKPTGSPGVKIRISRNGVSYISEVMASTLMGEIVTAVVDLPPERVEFPGGSVQITGLQLQMKNTKHNTKSALASPNLVNIDVDQIQLGVKGKITGTMNDNHFDGELSMTTMNLKVALSLAIRNNGNGIPNMHLAACKISQPVPSLFDIVAAKLTAGNKQVLEKSLTAGSNQIFEALICSRIEFVLENRINDRFSLIPNKLAMNTLAEQAIIDEVISKMALRRRQVRSNTQIRLTRAVGARFNLTRASNLLLDYGVVGNPSVVGNFLEINSVSEISLNGRGGTPFGAQPLILPSDLKEDAMMQLIVSDFVPNSLLYHGHNTGIFNTRIDSKTPHFASMMKSSCSISDGVFFCLGTLFRNLSVTFPGRELIMIFKTLKAPVMKFHPLSKGGIQFHIVGRIQILGIELSGQEVPFGSFTIRVDSTLKMKLSNTMTKPKVNIEKMTFKTESPAVITQAELDQAGILTKEVLQRMINDMLKEGIPIPIHPLYRLDKPKVRVLDRALLLQTNFSLNQKLLKQLTAAEVLK